MSRCSGDYRGEYRNAVACLSESAAVRYGSDTNQRRRSYRTWSAGHGTRSFDTQPLHDRHRTATRPGIQMRRATMRSKASGTLKYGATAIFVALAISASAVTAQETLVYPDGNKIEGVWDAQLTYRNC